MVLRRTESSPRGFAFGLPLGLLVVVATKAGCRGRLPLGGPAARLVAHCSSRSGQWLAGRSIPGWLAVVGVLFVVGGLLLANVWAIRAARANRSPTSR
jgi:hypothetical protein